MRALWIEDHQLIGDSLAILLQVVMPEVSLDKARDLDSALGLIATFRYELVLLDWWLGPHDGQATMRRLREAGCTTPVIVVSGDEREAVMRQAMALGAVGYVPKSADPDTLVAAIGQALHGMVTPRLARPEPGATAPGGLPAIDVAALFPELTSRQCEVFRALMRGLSDKQIGRDLAISDTTVKTHVRAILQAVGVHRRGEAAFAARQRGSGGY